MSLYAVKPRFQDLLRPLVGRLAAAGVKANQITVAAAVGSIVCAAIVAGFSAHPAIFLLIPAWLFVRMALNAADGMLAREFGQESQLGFYLNEIADVVSDAVLYAPFALVAPFGAFGIGLVIVLSLLTEFAGVLAAAAGTARRYDGPMGKSDRAVLFGALGLWIAVAGVLPTWIRWLIPVLVILLALTTANRVYRALGGSAGILR
ncbi:MAG: CDP-alcohol phosphatidyltransferase family protein [Xanthobacteraceae bacterium]|nr:CDP-alcohol phosphatidyltransferase family protein [Xanthobacteraceae bacterium]